MDSEHERHHREAMTQRYGSDIATRARAAIQVARAAEQRRNPRYLDGEYDRTQANASVKPAVTPSMRWRLRR
jgi:hypothetical protein